MTVTLPRAERTGCATALRSYIISGTTYKLISIIGPRLIEHVDANMVVSATTCDSCYSGFSSNQQFISRSSSSSSSDGRRRRRRLGSSSISHVAGLPQSEYDVGAINLDARSVTLKTEYQDFSFSFSFSFPVQSSWHYFAGVKRGTCFSNLIVRLSVCLSHSTTVPRTSDMEVIKFC